MPLTISDEQLQTAGMNADQARVEIACRLFEAGKLTLWPAAQWAGLTRPEFEQELLSRRIPIYRPTVEELRAEMATQDALGI